MSSPKSKTVAQAPRESEVSAAAAASIKKKLRKQKQGFAQTALAGETGGFGGRTALG